MAHVGVPHKLARKPQEGLLKVVVRLCGDVIILQILLAMESDLLCLHLPLLDVNLITHQHNGDVLTYAHHVSVPVGDVFVGDARGDVEL